MKNTPHPNDYKKFIARFTNGQTRKLWALHQTQAMHIARGIARANAWNVSTVAIATN
jgi:hypothetical protein